MLTSQFWRYNSESKLSCLSISGRKTLCLRGTCKVIRSAELCCSVWGLWGQWNLECSSLFIHPPTLCLISPTMNPSTHVFRPASIVQRGVQVASQGSGMWLGLGAAPPHQGSEVLWASQLLARIKWGGQPLTECFLPYFLTFNYANFLL